ncbi:MAG: Pyridoxine 4-dehydrogenase [Peltula sp. TS41687]|nr:MAG: Pyridoxine 4-dehydrogenase [Peltula sp. TS41687]
MPGMELEWYLHGGGGGGGGGFTWRPNPAPQEQAFGAMRAALKAGSNFWNGGELYGTAEYNSLHLLNQYFTKYPEDADKVVLSIKGAVKNLVPDGSPEGVRASVENCVKVLGGTKTLDIFECARVDPKTPIETTIGALAELVKEGKIKGIGLSEVKAETIRRAHKVHPIAAVEVELSLWATEHLTNGVVDTCAELGIPIVAYSPIGRGFLTGQIKTLEDLPEADFRRHLPRFQPENFDKNLELVRDLERLAENKGCTPAQLAISWVKALSGSGGRGVIVPIPGATTEERVVENTKEVELSEKDLKEIEEILGKAEVFGDRYGGPVAALMNG